MIESAGRPQGAKDDDIVAEARKRYRVASDAASKNRESYREAMRFAAGNQWDDRLKQSRESQNRPCLTMDRLGTHINQIVNDQRQSKPAIKCNPVDDKADVKTAEIYNGVIRNIEHLSNAPMVYETASFSQVAAGMGAWRVLTEYADENAFEQDIKLKRILDPMSVTFDPNAREMDASDGMYAFVEDSIDRETFKEQYPDINPDDWAGASDDLGWWNPDSVRCAEYYRVVMRPTRLFLLADGSVMDEQEFAKSERNPAEVVDQRPSKRREVQWFKIAGASVADSRVWPGRWIPLVRIVGNETVVDGKILYTGLTQRAYDAQRMYNYQVSTMVEMLSLQKTAPFIGAKGQFKGVEARWARANATNPAYLEYEPVELNGQFLPAPQRQPAPQVPTGNVQAMQAAAQDLQWITGQHAANFGAASNETSGRAIMARQREGDTATYHYLDNLSRGILHTGRILVDLIPKIYDTKRILRVLGDDESPTVVMHDPEQPEAVRKVQDETGAIKRIYNLNVGRYDVAVSVGPSFGTLRAESTEAMTQLLSGNPNLWTVIGDLYVRGQNWPNAQAIADRLAKTVPPEIKGAEGEENDPEAMMGQMQATMQQLEGALQEREQALQQAAQIVQQLEGQLQDAQVKQQAEQAQVLDKTNAEIIKAETERYKADASIEVARIGAEVAQAQALREQTGADIETVKKLMFMMAERMNVVMPETESEEEKEAEPETILLAQIAEGQQQTANAISLLAQSMQNRPQMAVDVLRGSDGRAQQFVMRPTNGG